MVSILHEFMVFLEETDKNTKQAKHVTKQHIYLDKLEKENNLLYLMGGIYSRKSLWRRWHLDWDMKAKWVFERQNG